MDYSVPKCGSVNLPIYEIITLMKITSIREVVSEKCFCFYCDNTGYSCYPENERAMDPRLYWMSSGKSREW
nr:unnamed protein product [Fasciola hepatica]